MQPTLYDSSGILVCWCQRSRRTPMRSSPMMAPNTDGVRGNRRFTTQYLDLPMWPSGLRTWALCAVERGKLSVRGSNYIPSASRTKELFQIIPMYLMNREIINITVKWWQHVAHWTVHSSLMWFKLFILIFTAFQLYIVMTRIIYRTYMQANWPGMYSRRRPGMYFKPNYYFRISVHSAFHLRWLIDRLCCSWSQVGKNLQ